MAPDFVISLVCLGGAIVLGLNLAIINQRRLDETHDLRMALYRQKKKLKNEALKRFLGL